MEQYILNDNEINDNEINDYEINENYIDICNRRLNIVQTELSI